MNKDILVYEREKISGQMHTIRFTRTYQIHGQIDSELNIHRQPQTLF